MPVEQGDLGLLQHPAAQELLASKIPARLAYIATDGTPRVIPIWFHWNGNEFVMGTPPKAPKLKALARNPRVSLTIDDNTFPHKVLPGSRNWGRWCRPWCGSRSSPIGLACWIFRRAFPALFRSEAPCAKRLYPSDWFYT